MPSPAVNYKTIADSVATLLFPRAEVVLYDLAKQKTVHIANNISKRKIGDDWALEKIGGDVVDSNGGLNCWPPS